MTRRKWPLAVVGLASLAGIAYFSQPVSRPVAVARPEITPEEADLRERDGSRRSVGIQTGTGDAHFIAGEPLLVFPPAEIHRPKPNEGDTGSHWYTGEAATAEQRK
jgi:hypothetical protein